MGLCVTNIKPLKPNFKPVGEYSFQQSWSKWYLFCQRDLANFFIFMHSLSSFVISSVAFLNGLLLILPLHMGNSESCAVFHNCQDGEQAVLSCVLTSGLTLASFAQLLYQDPALFS